VGEAGEGEGGSLMMSWAQGQETARSESVSRKNCTRGGLNSPPSVCLRHILHPSCSSPCSPEKSERRGRTRRAPPPAAGTRRNPSASRGSWC